MAEPLSILNIGGHPKDTILYAGGTMAKHAARGDRVTILTPTTGLSHHLEAIDEYRNTGDMPDMGVLVEERHQELVEAAAEIGVTDVRFLGHADDIVTVDKDIINDIADVIGEIQPNMIVTHWPNDTVPAHGLATQMTLLAIDAASGIRPGKSYAPTGGDTGGEQAQLFYHTQIGRTNVMESLNVRILRRSVHRAQPAAIRLPPAERLRQEDGQPDWRRVSKGQNEDVAGRLIRPCHSRK